MAGPDALPVRLQPLPQLRVSKRLDQGHVQPPSQEVHELLRLAAVRHRLHVEHVWARAGVLGQQEYVRSRAQQLAGAEVLERSRGGVAVTSFPVA
jgi:hypothetical protein